MTEKKRITVTLSNDLYMKLKERADLLGSSIPSVLLFYAMQGITQENAINSLNSINSVISLFNNSELKDNSKDI